MLPIGVQTFLKMRSNPYVYVDKTEHIYRLAISEGIYFLSRPRRFGKSLMVSTFKELFEGNRILFKDLWIEDKWDWSQKSPVIHLSFASMAYKELGLDVALKIELTRIAKEIGVTFTTDSYQQHFKEIIHFLNQKHYFPVTSHHNH